MRALRPGRLFPLPSGLWVLDEFQPVAAVLDPSDGRVRRLVSWPQLDPPPGGHQPSPVVRADAEALWVQNRSDGPLVRVGPDGVGAAVWTRGRGLVVATGRRAWCSAGPRPQELVHGAQASPVSLGGGDVLMCADADGRTHEVFLDAPVHALRPGPQGVWAQLDVGPWSLDHLGADVHEVRWSSRWVLLPADGPVPARVHAGDGRVEEPAAALAGDGAWHTWWLDPEGEESVTTADHLWRAGMVTDRGGGTRQARVVVAARTGTGPVRTIDLPGRSVRVAAAAAVGDGLAVVTAPVPLALGGADPSGGPTLHVVDPRDGRVQVWVAPGQVDVGEHCWPLLPRPLDTDSYLRQVRQRWDHLDTYWQGRDGAHPLAGGMSRSRVRVIGDWPHTHLECTFDFVPHPGVRLRRRVPLFDERGAVADPEHAEIHLMEDLDTRNLPAVEEARDGVLDV